VKQSGIGRTHGLLGLREMVQPKYVSLDRGRGAELWWYPYDAEITPLLARAATALYATSFVRRVLAQIGLLRYGRVWRRLGLVRLIRHLDKLF
jgi:hypothetical protein